NGDIDLSAATGGITITTGVTLRSDASFGGTGGDVTLGSLVTPTGVAVNGLTIAAGDGTVSVLGLGTLANPLEFLTITTSNATTLGGDIFTDQVLGTGNINLNLATG